MSVLGRLAEVRGEIEEKGRRVGLIYPWWLPVVSGVAQIGGALIAVWQRDALATPLLLSVLVVAAPCLLDFARRELTPWWLYFGLVAVGVAWLLMVPVSDGQMADVAPLILTVAVAEETVLVGFRRGSLAAVVAAALVLLLGRPDVLVGPFYVGEIAFGLVIGLTLRWQMRALAAEQTAREEERQRATLAERQRVAREIHDLVAHSLSVTMLHVTGARRALAEDGDVNEAVDALTDAERIGRQAMADIRRTVSVLNTEGDRSEAARPLPGASELPDLVADVRSAGLDVRWEEEGDLGSLPPAVGLALFRVVQESLTNVAKHAPGSRASVRVQVSDDEVRLHVANACHADRSTGGSGVNGMRSRVVQLGGRLEAGRHADGWRVDAVIPLVDREPAPEDPACAVRRALTS